MKQTALTKLHEALGAKMVPFAGYLMPVSYEGVNAEHETVRGGVGVFDVSHMGEFFIEGPQALDLIQSICSNDASVMADGQAQYSCMPNADNGIVDDLIIYRFNQERYMLVVNASNIQKDWDWIEQHNTMGALMTNRSDDYSLLAVQGPKAIDVLQQVTALDLSALKFYTFTQGTVAELNDVIVSATGYTGSGGFEVYCKNDQAQALWTALFEAGQPSQIKPIGLAARDTLRLEMGYCLYGNDIDDQTSPIEAGLGWITKFNKAFTNHEALANQKLLGPQRKLVAFELKDRGIPRQGYRILDAQANPIGQVTSGTMSPSLGKGIGLGYVTSANKDLGTRIFIEIRQKSVAAEIVRLPFYKKA